MRNARILPRMCPLLQAPEIPNPEFVDDPEVYLLPPLKFVGFEIWQVKAGVVTCPAMHAMCWLLVVLLNTCDAHTLVCTKPHWVVFRDNL